MRFIGNPFHAVALARLDFSGWQIAGSHFSTAPWQQFSVRKPSSAFIVSNCAA
jgi:hypothetical protein